MMMSQVSPRSLMQSAAEFWGCIVEGKLDKLDALCAPNCEFSIPGDSKVDLDRFKEIVADWRTAFPNTRSQRVDVSTVQIVDTNRLIATSSHILTHDGPFVGDNGSIITAYHRDISFNACSIMVSGDQGMVSLELFFDRAEIYGQMRPNYSPEKAMSSPTANFEHNPARGEFSSAPTGPLSSFPWAAVQ
jgi:hypothetical protein